MHSGKNFSLVSHYKDIDVILLVKLISDEKLPYRILVNKFQASQERVFELPRVIKVLTQIVDDRNGEYIYKGKNVRALKLKT